MTLTLRQFFPMARFTGSGGWSPPPNPVTSLKGLAMVLNPELATNPHLSVSALDVMRRFSVIPDQPDIQIIQTANPTHGLEALTVSYSQRVVGTSPVIYSFWIGANRTSGPIIGAPELSDTFTLPAGSYEIGGTCIVATKHGGAQHQQFVEITVDKLTPPPPLTVSPSISVTHSGTWTDAKFTVNGSGFLPNLPGTTTKSVAVRVVDANAAIETRRVYAASDSKGAMAQTVIEGDITGLVLNAAGKANIAFSATDGRSGPGVDGFLWSNTVRISFP
jgi:hypothetical protein